MSGTATYSRVSSGRQEQEETIKSQLAALHARLRQDGVTDWVDFIDENKSGPKFLDRVYHEDYIRQMIASVGEIVNESSVPYQDHESTLFEVVPGPLKPGS